MLRRVPFAAVALWLGVISTWSGAQSPVARPTFDTFEVATVKPADSGAETGRFLKMQAADRFIARNYTLKLLIAAAYDLNPRTISGGPAWMDSAHYDIEAVTPGDVQPSHEEQMTMLRDLLNERFQLRFHREAKEFSIYALELAKGGPTLKRSTARPGEPTVMGPGMAYADRIVLPGRNASMGDLASILQRGILDRPVVDQTGLTGRYDFDLRWAPDESQFGGDVAAASAVAPSPPLFEAVQQELGLRLRATRGSVAALVVDSAERPSAN